MNNSTVIDYTEIIATGLTGRYIKKRGDRWVCYSALNSFLDAFRSEHEARKFCNVPSYPVYKRVGDFIFLVRSEAWLREDLYFIYRLEGGLLRTIKYEISKQLCERFIIALEAACEKR